MATPASHSDYAHLPSKKSKSRPSAIDTAAASASTGTLNSNSTAPTTMSSGVGSTRFIGDLDPASVLLTLRNVEKDDIGVWVKGASIHQPLNQQLLTYLNSLHAFDLPPKQDRDGLIHTYFKYLHPLIPLLGKTAFLQMHARDECPTLLLHAVLLAACRHPSARKYIQSRSPRHFATLTATKIRALMFADIERDKLTVVRVLALMSLHSEGSDGLEKSCSDLEQAFHYAHFLGLHHERQSHPDQAPMRRLWWCLWCLDRMSACVSARPVISRLDDVGVTGMRPSEEGWLTKLYDVCQLLDRVIAMYRPIGSTIPPEVDFEVSYGKSDDSPFAAFMHLIRHAACILAHKRAPESPEVNAAILLHSTKQILHIVKTQPALPPLPAVPYAVSLTLTVYLRLYPSPEAIAGWHESCAVLDDLSKTWWVAEAMGGMARSVFRKLEEDLANRQAEEAQAVPIVTSPTIRSKRKNVPRNSHDVVVSGSSQSPPVVTLANDASLASAALPMSSGAPTANVTSRPTSAAGTVPALETQFLEMFSDLPNPTSFLDQALMLDDIEADLWIPNLQFENNGATTSNGSRGVSTDGLGSTTAAGTPSTMNFSNEDAFVIPGFQPAPGDESTRFLR